MWIYTKNGFYSIVQDKTDPDYLIVRARVKGDLEALLPGVLLNSAALKSAIKETPDSDYRYRVKLEKELVSELIADKVSEIDYPNFKDSISDKRRAPYYGTAWAAMVDMQEDLINDTNKK